MRKSIKNSKPESNVKETVLYPPVVLMDIQNL
jgi:hypothetical protein